MVFPIGDGRNDLHVRRRTKLQVNPCPAQMLHQPRVLVAARSMANALRVQQPQRLPHALRPTCLARMRSAKQPLLACMPTRRKMRIQRETCFIAGNIQRNYTAAAKGFHQLRSLQTLRFIEMPQRAQDRARLDASSAALPLHRALHHGNNLLGTSFPAQCAEAARSESPHTQRRPSASCSNRSSTTSCSACSDCISWKPLGARDRKSARLVQRAGAT